MRVDKEYIINLPEFREIYGEVEYLGSGIARTAYLSKKTNTVVKIPYSTTNSQHSFECDFFEILKENKDHVKFFPMLGFKEFDGVRVHEFKYVKPMVDILSEYADQRYCSVDSNGHHVEEFNDYVKLGLMTEQQAIDLSDFLYENQIIDIHNGNFGIDESGQICVFDIGSSSDSGTIFDSDEGSDYSTECNDSSEWRTNCICTNCRLLREEAEESENEYKSMPSNQLKYD